MNEIIKKKVLVVDDDKGTVLLLTKILTEKGFEVLKAYDGQEALALIKQTIPDLIIIDRMMPKMDGIKACALMKADKRFYKIPIVMITASAEKSDQELSAKIGVDAFLNKLLNAADVVGKVEILINRV